MLIISKGSYSSLIAWQQRRHPPKRIAAVVVVAVRRGRDMT